MTRLDDLPTHDGQRLRARRRIAAYGVCRDADRVLLVRASEQSVNNGWWFLPGGGVEHGEHPADAVVREIAEETGLAVEVIAVRDVISDVDLLPHKGVLLHHDRVIYEVRVVGGALRDEVDGTTDHAEWVPVSDLPAMRLMPHVALVLGVLLNEERPDTARALIGTAEPEDPIAAAVAAGQRPKRQRFAAYGLVTDPGGRVLLTKIAAGFPGAGLWHLPGGGTDHGEAPSVGLLRELVEEADQVGRVVGLLAVTHRHVTDAIGPERVPIDQHGVRALFRVAVDKPTSPQVTEAVGGSTTEAGWFEPAVAAGLHLTEIAREAIRRLTRGEGVPSAL